MIRHVLLSFCAVTCFGCHGRAPAEPLAPSSSVRPEAPAASVPEDTPDCPPLTLSQPPGQPPSVQAGGVATPLSVSLNPFLTAESIPFDSESLEQDVSLHIGTDYRRDGTCGRVVAWYELDGREAEAFVYVGRDGRSLGLVDSLGQFVGPQAGSSRVPQVEGEPVVTFDEAGYSLVTARGRTALADVLPYGRWYARPHGVRYEGSDLVLVHTCDPYSDDDFCGLESEGGRPLADPPSPLVTAVAVYAEGLDQLVLEPFADGVHVGLADFPGTPLWGRDRLAVDVVD